MTDEEKQELEALREKCIDKRSNKPKKLADMADLQRMSELLAIDEPQVEDECSPLTAVEEDELADLEGRYNPLEGRSVLQLTAPEMLRMAKLRTRKKESK